MEYWKECISEALEDAGIVATDEQIEIVAGWVDGAHENYGMFHGYDCIPNHMETEVEQLKNQIKMLKASHSRKLRGIVEGVAKRRNVDVDCVSIDDGGLIYISPR